MIIAGSLGSIGYAYSVGKEQGERVCNEEKLQSQLNRTKLELEAQIGISELQSEQIGEAQSHLEQERIKSADLQKYIDNISSGGKWCISPGMREELHKFRYGTKDKNS